MHNSETLPKGIESWVELYLKFESLPKHHEMIQFEKYDDETHPEPIGSFSWSKTFVKEKAFNEMLLFQNKLTNKEFRSLFHFIDSLFKQVPHFKEHYLYKKFLELKPKNTTR